MANDGDAVERHQEQASRLRGEIEGLVKHAHVLLHGDIQGKRPAAHRPPDPVRIEREKELEANLQRADWYRREIKRLRQELESRDTINPLIGGPHVVLERDPMELYNLIAEKRKELQRVQHAGKDLDRLAEVQKRAEEANRAVNPQMEARLQHMKREVETQKRKNVKLQADRVKISNARKATEEEVRVAGGQLRGKAALLNKQAKPLPAPYSDEEPKFIKQLRRDIDIIRSAVAQDERKFKIAEKEAEQELEWATEHTATLRASIRERESELTRLKTELEGMSRPKDALPQLPLSSAVPPSVKEGAVARGIGSSDDAPAPDEEEPEGSPAPSPRE